MKNPWTRKINHKEKRPLQEKIEFTNWIVLGFFLLLSAVFASANFVLGVLSGGLISILNFYGLRRGLKKSFGTVTDGQRPAKAPLMFKYFLRLAATSIALYVLLVKTTADIFGLVLGLSTVIIAIVLTVIMTLFDKSYLEEV
ncbi:MAG: ATP synthase subunit I [Desulfobacterales bacterium]|nr:ATP synthase subunit I [Desulfobacterales bacterium]